MKKKKSVKNGIISFSNFIRGLPMTFEQKHHEKLEKLIELVPIIRQLFATDVGIAISDTEKVIHLDFPEYLNPGNAVGHKLNPEDPMTIVMKKNRREMIIVPEELYGLALKLIAVPITDENNKVIGSICISTNRDNHSKLLKAAEQFATSAEEISASTEELSASANNFNSYLEKLSESQKEMTKQVEDTTKILELINNVAKNTRILGFNAGIEAARAGEYGKGFSVVAKEITKLAEQSADSVNEIRNLLEQLKDKVKQVATYVNSTVEVSSNQTSALNDISNSIQNIAHAAEEIEQMAHKIF